MGKICHRDACQGEDGFLIYIKPMMRGTEPPDVVAYHAVMATDAGERESTGTLVLRDGLVWRQTVVFVDSR